MESTKLLWNLKEAAEALNVSYWTILRYIKQGKLNPVRFNRLVFIEPDECRRFIEKHRKPPDEPDASIQPDNGQPK